jgi:hypothetical protein
MMKGKYKAIPQRIFVEDRETGKPTLVDCPVVMISMDKSNGWHEFFFEERFDEKTLPPEFDTIFPQNVYLVWQIPEVDRSEFFDPNRIGKMRILEEFHTIFKGQVLMLIKQGDDVSFAPPDLKFVCRSIKTEIGGV